MNDTKYSRTTYISANIKNSKVNVEGYTTLYQINSYNYNSIETFNGIELKYMDSNESIKVNLQKEFKRYIDVYLDLGEEGLDDYFENHNEIQIENNKKLIIKSFYLNYDENSKLVKNYSIQGYLLEK